MHVYVNAGLHITNDVLIYIYVCTYTYNKMGLHHKMGYATGNNDHRIFFLRISICTFSESFINIKFSE